MPDTKVIGFTGIKHNINPLADRNSLIRCTNMDIHSKPGILTTRPSYWLKYETPVDELNRITAVESISFDNFFEKESSDEGVEVTCEVQRGTVQSSITTYKFNGINIWIRPYWNGVYWEDKWQWLNETFITKIISIDSTYLNKIVVAGDYGNLTQWTIVNVTRNIALPVSILAYESGTNTTFYTSLYSHNWNVDDELVIMRNYFPLTNQAWMYDVTKQEISFHRLPSKIRIGFGGKKNRIALGIEYVKRTIHITDYSFTNTDPFLVGKESQTAKSNKIICQCYTQFNNNLEFDLNILSIVGDYAAGTYYFRMTAVLDGVNEVLVLSKSITTTTASKFFPVPKVRLGGMSRRLSSVKIYFSESGEDFYLFKEYPISIAGIQNNPDKDWLLQDDGYIIYQPEDVDTEIYTEVSSAHDPDDNAIGSWVEDWVWNTTNNFDLIVTGSTGVYYLSISALKDNLSLLSAIILTEYFDAEIKNLREYSLTIKLKATKTGTVEISFIKKTDDGEGYYEFTPKKTFPVTTADQTFSFDLTSPDLKSFPNKDGLGIRVYFNASTSGSIMTGDHLDFTEFTIKEKQTNYINSLPSGALDLDEMGYTPSLNLVRDWAAATVINGQTFVGAGYIDKRYPNIVFYSPVSGAGVNQYDVLPASKFHDSDKDTHRGEIIIGLTSLLNLSLLILTENGAIVLDPSTGSTIEVARGYGLITKETLQKFRGIIYWCSLEDIVLVSAASGYNPQVISEDSVREYYNKIKNKTAVSSCIDAYGCYHISFESTETIKELVFTDRGWIDYARTHHPIVMRNGYLNLVWFMDSLGNIYSLPTNLTDDIGYADFYGKKYKEW